MTQRLLASGEGSHAVFSKCFSGWDYSLMHEGAAETKIEELLADFKVSHCVIG